MLDFNFIYNVYVEINCLIAMEFYLTLMSIPKTSFKF